MHGCTSRMRSARRAVEKEAIEAVLSSVFKIGLSKPRLKQIFVDTSRLEKTEGRD